MEKMSEKKNEQCCNRKKVENRKRLRGEYEIGKKRKATRCNNRATGAIVIFTTHWASFIISDSLNALCAHVAVIPLLSPSLVIFLLQYL